MKVRITHSLDLSEVPDQLIDFVSRFSDAIKQMDSKSDDCLGAASVSSDSPFKYRLLHECVAGLRTQIADLDQELNDFGLLLSGYINIIEKPTAPTTVNPQQLTREHPVSDKIDAD